MFVIHLKTTGHTGGKSTSCWLKEEEQDGICRQEYWISFKQTVLGAELSMKNLLFLNKHLVKIKCMFIFLKHLTGSRFNNRSNIIFILFQVWCL